MAGFLPRMMKTLILGMAAVAVSAALGQARPTGTPTDYSKFEIYGGYGYWNPEGGGINGNEYPTLYKPNVTGSLTYYFSRHFGFQLEGSYFSIGHTLTPAGVCNAVPCSPLGQRLYTGEGGLVYRYPIGRLVPFAHVLGGGERLNGPVDNPLTWGWTAIGGVGVDFVLPILHDHLAVRPIQADYEYQQVSYGPLYLPANTNGGFASFPALKLSGGIVFRLGGEPEIGRETHNDLAVGCDASPSSVYPGDPVQVSANPMNENPKRPMSMTWTSTGGQLTETQMGASIATAGLAPGQYTVAGTLMQGRHTAQCTANFTVKAFEPPTLSCSADPATVPQGGVTTITAVGGSAANRTLTYSFTSDAGQITGTGPKVQLATAGSTASTINVTCNVVDDLGKTAQAATSVAVLTQQAAALPPPLADTQALCNVSFDRDKRRPVRVDNEAKACLDDIALDLQRQPDAKLVIVGNFGNGETAAEGAERSLNVQQYLVDEKGIDAGRIEVRYGTATGRGVENILVPAGASYTSDQTTAFDPTSVKRVGQAYGKPGQHVGSGRHPARMHHRATHHAAARHRPVHRATTGHRHHHHKGAAATSAQAPV
jgi:outer membrane protein OmpA-like peptidoglycan-associated protein